WREQRFGRRAEDVLTAKVHQKQSLIIRSLREIAQDKGVGRENSAIDAVLFEHAKAGIGLAQLNEIAMQRIQLRKPVAIAPVELATFERAAVKRHRQSRLHFRRCD